MIKLLYPLVLTAAVAVFALFPFPAVSAPAASPPLSASASAARVGSFEETLEKNITEWIAALSAEKGFEAWDSAEWEVVPLGPGTHSWLVPLTAYGSDIGYLIVTQTADGGCQLTEYGNGPYPLFSLNTLRQSLLQRELIDSFSEKVVIEQAVPYYSGPLEGFWKVALNGAFYYFDAKTGGELPDLGDYAADADAVYTQEAASPTVSVVESGPRANLKPGIVGRLELLSADPYEQAGWIKDQAGGMDADFHEIKALLRSQKSISRLLLITKRYGGQALYPLPVTGYHTWSDDSEFVMLEHDGSRFLRAPLPTASKLYLVKEQG